MAFISERHDPPVCNQMAVYYRSFEKSGIGISSKTKTKLHRFNVDTTCPTEARSVVMEELHNTMEAFIKPMLVVVQGGKTV